MHCVDCHFAQDVHGDGNLYAEYQAAVQIQCRGLPRHRRSRGDARADRVRSDVLRARATSSRGRSRAALARGATHTPGNEPRFYRKDGAWYQRSMLYEHVEWKVLAGRRLGQPGPRGLQREGRLRQAAEAHVTARAPTIPSRWTAPRATPRGSPRASAATCRRRPTTGRKVRHFEGDQLRNLASYNPQVARDDVFMLGRSGDVKGYTDPATGETVGEVAVVRSSSAVIVVVEGRPTPRSSTSSSRPSRPMASTARRSTPTSRTRSARPRRASARTATSRRERTTTTPGSPRCSCSARTTSTSSAMHAYVGRR